MASCNPSLTLRVIKITASERAAQFTDCQAALRTGPSVPSYDQVNEHERHGNSDGTPPKRLASNRDSCSNFSNQKQ